jgi:hypothetical protein
MTDPNVSGGRSPEQQPTESQPPVDPQAAAEMARKLADMERKVRDTVRGKDQQKLAQIRNQVAEATETAIAQIVALEADEGKVKAELQKVDRDVDQKSSFKGNVLTTYEYVRALYDEFSANSQELVNLTVRDIPVESNKRIFTALFTDLKKDLITPATAPFINKILNKAMGGRIAEPLSALSVSEFASLESLDRGMFLEIVKVLKKGYPSGKQEVADRELVKLHDLIEARKQNKVPLTSLDAQIQESRAARTRTRGNRQELSKEEFSELLTLQNKLKSALSKVASVPDATKHFADMLDLAYTGIKTMERDDPAIARIVETIKNDSAFKAAFTDADWDRMQQLIDKEGLVQQIGQYELEMSGMYDVAERIQSLKYSNVFGKLINTDGTWNRQGMDELRRDIQSIVNELFKGVATDPFSPFQEAFNPQQEGIMFRYLRRTLLQFANAPEFMEMYDELAVREGFNTKPDFQQQRKRIQNSFKDLFSQLSNRMSLTLFYIREAHDTAQQESIPDDARARIMSKMTLSEIYRLHEDPVLRVAAALLPTYHLYRFAANGNQIPKGYYAKGQRNEEDQSHVSRDYLPDREMFVQDLQYIIRRAQAWDRRHHPGQARAFSETRHISDWEFETVTPIAELVTRLLTEEDKEVWANTIPYGAQQTEHPYDTMPRFRELLPFNPSIDWAIQRGGPDVESTIPGLKGLRLATDAEYNYDTRTGRLIPRKEFDPEEVYDEAMKLVVRAIPESEAELRENLRRKVYEHSIAYLDYIRGLLGSNNWKHEGGYGIMRSLEAKFRRDMLAQGVVAELYDDRKVTEEWLEKTAGYFSKYYMVDTWAGDAADAHLLELFRQKKNLSPNDKVDPTVVHKFEWEEFKSRYDGGARKYKHVMKINPTRGTDGEIETDLSFATYKKYRQRSEMARLFHEGLRKEPLVFFNTLTQLIPQLAEGTVKVTMRNGEEKEISAAEFYFDEAYAEHVLSDSAIEKRRKVRKSVLVMFGQENVPHIQKIMRFYEEAYRQFSGTEGTDQDKKNRAHQALYRTFTSASLIARGEGTDVKADYFATEDEIAQKGNMTAEEQQDLEMRIKAKKLYQDFVVSIIELGGHSEQDKLKVFGGKGREHTADVGDQRSLFHRFCRSWYDLKNCPYPPPFYIDTRGVITERPLNEDAPARRLGDQTEFYNIIKEDLSNFESKIKEWALASDATSGIDIMRSFRSELYSKAKLVDKGKAQDLVKQMTILWYKFGEQAGSGRIFPFDIIQELLRGKKGSMSKIKYGRSANSLSPSDMRTDLEWLLDNGCISEAQFREIQDLMQLEDLRIWGTDIIPSVAFALLLALLAIYISQALKEASES